MTRRRQLLCSVRSALSVALSAIAVFLPVGLARAGNGDFAYPFSCSWPSLTADFAGRDQLPESHEPPADWYRTDAQGHYANHGWGPAADALPAPVIPQGAQCNSRTWKQERILAVAMRYIYAPGNALGLQYRHHHIPGWDPTTSTYAGAPEDNPDPDNPDGPTAWSPGRGLDCSNFTAWVYNYGLGIKFGGDVHRQADGTAGPMGGRIPQQGPFEPRRSGLPASQRRCRPRLARGDLPRRRAHPRQPSERPESRRGADSRSSGLVPGSCRRRVAADRLTHQRSHSSGVSCREPAR